MNKGQAVQPQAKPDLDFLNMKNDRKNAIRISRELSRSDPTET